MPWRWPTTLAVAVFGVLNGLLAPIGLGHDWFEEITSLALVVPLMYGPAVVLFRESALHPEVALWKLTAWVSGAFVLSFAAAFAAFAAFADYDEAYYAVYGGLSASLLLLTVPAAIVWRALRKSRQLGGDLAAGAPSSLQSVVFVAFVTVVVAAFSFFAAELPDEALSPWMLLILVVPAAVVATTYSVLVARIRVGRWRGLGAAALIAALLVAGATAWMVRPRDVSWRLMAVEADGRVLVLEPDTFYARCGGRASGKLLGRDRQTVRLRVRLRLGTCTIPTYWDAPPDRTRAARVTLDAPLHGERITGPGVRQPDVVRDVRQLGRRDGSRFAQVELRMPRVVGLRPQDARALLGSGGHRQGVITWVGGADRRVVTAQEPAAGAVLRPRFDDRRRNYESWSRTPIRLTTAG